jgi:hypothetical protein
MKPTNVTVALRKGIRTDMQGMRDELQTTREELRDELRSIETSNYALMRFMSGS